MCFSAGASFAAAGVLISLGVFALVMNAYAVRLWEKYRKKGAESFDMSARKEIQDERKYWVPFLLTPLLFGIQQAFEGATWVVLSNQNDASKSGSGFAFFAYAFWPMWVPFICISLELKPANRQRPVSSERTFWIIRTIVIALLLLLGTGMFIYLFVSILTGDLYVTSSYSHLVYHFVVMDNPDQLALLIPYLACTILPFLLATSITGNYLLGLCVGGSAIIAYQLYALDTFPSVWCFFAAWLSILFFFARVRAVLQWRPSAQRAANMPLHGSTTSAV